MLWHCVKIYIKLNYPNEDAFLEKHYITKEELDFLTDSDNEETPEYQAVFDRLCQMTGTDISKLDTVYRGKALYPGVYNSIRNNLCRYDDKEGFVLDRADATDLEWLVYKAKELADILLKEEFDLDWLYGSIKNYEDLTSDDVQDLLDTVRIQEKDIEFKKKMAKQRAERGFGDNDVWGLNDWFLNTIPKMLKQLKETAQGYFEVDGNGDRIRGIGNEPGEVYQARWNTIMDMMIHLAEEANEETCSEKNEYEDQWYVYRAADDEDSVKAREELRRKIHERSDQIFEYRDRCKNEFFEMFSKYFWDLWD